jgi:hypothetical protein
MSWLERDSNRQQRTFLDVAADLEEAEVVADVAGGPVEHRSLDDETG